MQDLPAPGVILDLAIDQLNSIDPTGARAKFEMRMATAALQLVKRALELELMSDAREMARLRALLGEDASLEALNLRLCTLIRSGELTRQSPGLTAHLRAVTMEKLAIDQPSYAAYQRALQQAEGDA